MEEAFKQLGLLSRIAALKTTQVYVDGEPYKLLYIPNDLWDWLQEIPKDRALTRCSDCHKELEVEQITCGGCRNQGENRKNDES